MSIYELFFDDMIQVKSNLNLTYKTISEENILEVAKLRNNSRLREFKKNIKQKSIGIAAYKDDSIVGYGWIKWEGCYDNFFHITGDKGYLASFFVAPEYRGNGIYPCIIQELIKKTNKLYGAEYFLIGIQKENKASINGALKVGFSYLKHVNFLRAFKVTIPKKSI